jgi:DNA-binding NtrC family response regulator
MRARTKTKTSEEAVEASDAKKTTAMSSSTACNKTVEEQDDIGPDAQVADGVPGLLVVFCSGAPVLVPIPIERGRTEFGRTELAAHNVEDPRASRRHFAIEWRDELLQIHDLGSTNGLFVNGVRLSEPVTVPRGGIAVLRLGRTILLMAADRARFEPLRPLLHDGLVVGASLRAVHQRIAAISRAGQGVFFSGESGVGKEVAAKLYHRHSPRSTGPFVAVNCAAVPKELAERLFFGSTKGAYSDAIAAPGYLQAAHGGTLFLDEVADLDLSVQAKLLRALDTREVLPLGATRPERVELSLCAATLRGLREAVSTGSFREDLYYRIGRPEVWLPPLRDRLEEIACLVDRVSRQVGVPPGVSLIEACLLRRWPGNVRELCAEVRSAATLAMAASAPEVTSEFLDPHAGRPVRSESQPSQVQTVRLSDSEAERPASPLTADSAELDAIVRSASVALGLAQKTVRKLLPTEQLQALRARLAHEDPDTSLTLLRRAAAESLLTLLEDAAYSQSVVAASLGTSRTTLLKLTALLDIPRATSLDPKDIERAIAEAGGDEDVAARALKVSPIALKKRRTTQG